MFHKSLSYSLFIVLTALFLSGCQKKRAPKNCGFEYAKTIKEMEKDPAYITYPLLFSSEKFVCFNENSENYRDSAEFFIANKSNSDQGKRFAVVSMNSLPVNEYADLVDTCFKLFNQNKISEELLSFSILNQVNYKIAKYSGSIKVYKVLFRIKNSTRTSKSFKEFLERIISGKQWDEMKDVTEY